MSHRVQLSGNEMLNRKVLSSWRKVRSDETVRRETGRVFYQVTTYVLLTVDFMFAAKQYVRQGGCVQQEKQNRASVFAVSSVSGAHRGACSYGGHVRTGKGEVSN